MSTQSIPAQGGDPQEHSHALSPDLARVRAYLEGVAPDNAATSSTLSTLARAFDLSPFECDILALCAGMEVDEHLSVLCAAQKDHKKGPYPTFALAMTAFPNGHWSASLPTSPLRYWRLLRITPGETLMTSRLSIDETILHYLSAAPAMDERLHGIVQLADVPARLLPSHQAVAEQIVNIWSSATGRPPAIQLCGPPQAGPIEIAAFACGRLHLQLSVIRAHSVPAAHAEREELIRLCEREAVLANGAILLDFGPRNPDDAHWAPQSFLENLQCPVLAAAPEPLTGWERPVVRLQTALPTAEEQRTVWRDSLGLAPGEQSDSIDRVVSHFHFGAREIRAASTGRFQGGTPLGLWDVCRRQSSVRLEDLAQRIRPTATWDDLVLPKPQLKLLHELVSQVRWRTQVYEQWGFSHRSSRGLGISALFFGPSGTGKTMAAEVLANDLELDLFRIDLSAVVSKYIGETEKNLRRVFDAAEAGGAILLFDEADALFGQRSEIRDSHDRYANIEVSYLLQRIESYRGLAVLTSNMKQSLDTAFLRRIRFLVQFPFPEATERAEIWRRIFPRDTPREDVSAERLSQLGLAGGNIYNIALAAAFLAARERGPVRMRHLLEAARMECAKLERPLTDGEVGGWV